MTAATAVNPTNPPRGRVATGPTRPNLARRVLRRARRELAGLRRVTVTPAGPHAVQVSWSPGTVRRYDLDDPAAGCHLRGQVLRLLLPDAAALARLAASGLLTGQVRRLRLRLSAAPEWLITGVRPPRLGRFATGFTWQRRGDTLQVGLGWSRPYDLARALADTLAAVLRARPWDQASGPIFTLDRGAWLAGASSWPQGVLAAGPPAAELDGAGRPLGPYLPAQPPPGPPAPPLVTAVANPYGRRLVGAAARYRLVAGRLVDEAGRQVLRLDPATAGEGAVLAPGLAKYAVVSVDSADPPLRALAACGMLFTAPDPAVRAELAALGLVTVTDPAEVTDLRGYALSVAAARRATLAGDPALRRTALGGDGTLPLPTVTAVLSSIRPEQLETCLGYLAGQTYPALEVVVGLHGYNLPEATRRRWAESLPCRLRVRWFPAEQTFGSVLGELSRIADGELLTKLDDDDHYGPNHVTDLVLAWHTSGADLVAKGARFVHFPERDKTIDRAWAAPEIFDVTPAGGTMLLGRGALQQAGGWSHSSKHVDADLLARLRSAGGLVYRTHSMEYVYVRRTTGHTFVTEIDHLAEQSEQIYPGLPDQLINPPGGSSW